MEIELRVNKEMEEVRTYVVRKNINGNRRTLIINDVQKAYCFSGSFLGGYGKVQEDFPLREARRIVKELEASGYTSTWKIGSRR